MANVRRAVQFRDNSKKTSKRMENVLYFNRATVPLREPHLLTYIDYASHIIRLREPHSLPAINAFFMYPFIKLQKSEKKNLISDSVGRFRTFSRISKFKK